MIVLNMTTRTDGLQNVRRRLTAIQNAPQGILEQVAKEEVAATQQRIRSSKTDPQGRAWAPWSMATMRARRRDGTASRGLLNRTGALLASITSRVSEKTITIYSNIGYAKYLQFGTRKMPARPFLGWSNASINRVKQLLREAALK